MPLIATPAPAPVFKAKPKPEQWRDIRRAAERREPAMKKALRSAFADLQASVDLDRLEEALESGRVETALNAIDFDALRPSLIGAVAVLNEAFTGGGTIAGRQLVEQLRLGGTAKHFEAVEKKKTEARYAMRFDLTNPEAVAWAGKNAGKMITQISGETRKGVQALIVRGFNDGIAPKPLAKLIREQGIGLNAPQATALLNFRAGLVAKGFAPDKIDKLLIRKYQKSIAYRSYTIARHELLQASNHGQSMLWSQSQEAGLIPPNTLRKWIITPDDRLCPICSQMVGERALAGLKTPWQTPKGAVDIPQQIHVQCRCAQGLVIDLAVAQPMAEAAVQNPSPELHRLMPKLVESPSATLPPGMMTPKPAKTFSLDDQRSLYQRWKIGEQTIDELAAAEGVPKKSIVDTINNYRDLLKQQMSALTPGQLETIFSLLTSGKQSVRQVAAGLQLERGVIADAFTLMQKQQAQALAELQGKWPVADNVPRTMGTRYPAKVESHYEGWKSKLSPNEYEAIRDYTGSGFARMNKYLREGGDINSTRDTQALLSKHTQSALMRAPEPPPPELVWRSVSSWPDEFKDGSVQRFKGFQSTTIDPKFAESWSSTLLEIKPKRGAYVETFSKNKGEQEYLLPHNSEFKVIGRRSIKFRDNYGNVYDRTVIQLEQVD